MIIPVIFEDNDILVINKPSGIVVHPFDFSEEQTVLDFLHAHVPETFLVEHTITLQDKRVIPLGGIVHKLDRETSGVMVIAKNSDTYHELAQQFVQHTVEKSYIALVEGVVEKDQFTINAPLGRSKKDYKQSTNPINPRGALREAITDVEVIKRLEDTTIIRLIPRTGRTHQLRAHMSSIEHPIAGDVAYGSMVKNSRIMLHAEKLTFTLHGKTLEFEAPIPGNFSAQGGT